jgi:hypothetical protein
MGKSDGMEKTKEGSTLDGSCGGEAIEKRGKKIRVDCIVIYLE